MTNASAENSPEGGLGKLLCQVNRQSGYMSNPNACRHTCTVSSSSNDALPLPLVTFLRSSPFLPISLVFLPLSITIAFLWPLSLFPTDSFLSYLYCDATLSNKHVFFFGFFFTLLCTQRLHLYSVIFCVLYLFSTQELTCLSHICWTAAATESFIYVRWLLLWV